MPDTSATSVSLPGLLGKLPLYLGVGTDIVRIGITGYATIRALLRNQGIEADEATIARLEQQYNAALAHEEQIANARAADGR